MCELDQASACCKNLRMAVCLGGPGQDIAHTWPLWTRALWTSAGQPETSDECEHIALPKKTMGSPEHRNI